MAQRIASAVWIGHEDPLPVDRLTCEAIARFTVGTRCFQLELAWFLEWDDPAGGEATTICSAFRPPCLKLISSNRPASGTPILARAANSR